ncbi:CYC2-like cyclin [Perkinsela sp. CCAP 1560/4]|nr:CYC2-like cyclin [Perkinsela sp. CCAP 1560/4]|eukprot:KNH08334.1 CYC2-like cyclin [Perkinsela sp. CCAP 1560/4]
MQEDNYEHYPNKQSFSSFGVSYSQGFSSSQTLVSRDVNVRHNPDGGLFDVKSTLSQSDPVAQTLSVSPHIDLRHADDPRYMSEYMKDIMVNLYNAEKRVLRQPYLESQPEITEKMRIILIDWLVEVHMKFRCRTETLFLAVDIVDRYLALVQTSRSTLQLVGITALLLAAKYEEIWPPEVKDCVYISANTYTREDILRMERSICGSLQFRFTKPNIIHFLSRLVEVLDAPTELRHMSLFFAEITLLNYALYPYQPSLLAAACVFLALRMQDPATRWDHSLQYYSQYSSAEVHHLAKLILEFAEHIISSRFVAVKKKYSTTKFSEIALRQMPTFNE